MTLDDALVTAAAPASPVGADGRPAFGAYRGACERVVWDGLAGRPGARGPLGALWRKLHQKTWCYASIATAECVVALAVIDVGVASSVFAYVFDRRARRLLADHSYTGLPGAARFSDAPGVGARATFRQRDVRFAIARDTSGWHLSGSAPGFELVASLDARTAPATLCAIADIAGGVANCTHKSPGLAARGHVEVAGADGGGRFELAGGAGAVDHTRGLLARDTRWRWASASSTTLSLNLVEDFNGPVENVVWVGDELVPVGPVRFEYDSKATSRPWHIRSLDGRLALEFRPEGERRQDRDLWLVKSWYVQPIGTFHGTLRRPGRAPIDVRDLAGVTEDHVARW